MDQGHIESKLIAVLAMVQSLSGHEVPQINGATCPPKDLKEFNSKIWPVATGMLASALAVEIPKDMNIFRDKATKQLRTVDGIAKFLADFLKPTKTVAAE